MVGTPLPESPRKSLHMPHNLILEGKVDLPEKRAISKHPDRLWNISHRTLSLHTSSTAAVAEGLVVVSLLNTAGSVFVHLLDSSSSHVSLTISVLLLRL